MQAGAFIRRKPSLLGTEWDVLESEHESRRRAVSVQRVHQVREPATVLAVGAFAGVAVEADMVEEFGLTELPVSREGGCATGAGDADE